MRWRRRAKSLLVHLAADFGPQHWGGDGRLLVLTYHRVLPREHPAMCYMQPGMYVHPETLRMHLEVLESLLPVMPLGRWVERAVAGASLPRRAVAITFDDGWRDNFDHAFPLLRTFGVPATIFLVSALVGTERGFWPERLARALLRAEQAPALLSRAIALGLIPASAAVRRPQEDRRLWLDRAIEFAKRLPDTVVASRVDALISSGMGPGAPARGLARALVASGAERVLPLGEPEEEADAVSVGAPGTVTTEPRELVNWEEVRQMAATGLVDFGSHTKHHRRLAPGQHQAVLREEIEGSKSTLTERIGVEPSLFCFPNGDVGPEGLAIVRRSYRGACTNLRGWNSPRGDPWAIRRVSIHEGVAGDRTRFLARLSSWL